MGGTTLHYQGEAHRFSAHGFKEKSLYGYAEDWPISYKDLEPYYENAEVFLGVSGLNGNPCSDNNELAVYIHGVWTGQIAVKEQIDRTN